MVIRLDGLLARCRIPMPVHLDQEDGEDDEQIQV